MIAKNRSILLGVWLLAWICGCTAGQSNVPAPHTRWSVAVFDYENLSPLNTVQVELGELLATKAIEAIAEADRYDVVERQHLERVLEELRLGTSVVADRQTQLKLGEITGARLMVFGSYQIIANLLRLDIRLVDVESGRVINAVSQVAEEHNPSGWLDASARSIAALFHF